MDPRLLDALRNAPSLDLYQLSLTAHQMLADPQRIIAIRTQLYLGARVMFFHHRTHDLVPGTVVEFRPTEVAIQDDATRKQWWLPYAAIVPDPTVQRVPEPPTPKPTMRSVNFQVGNTVGFTDKYMREHVGKITRLNDKTVSVESDGGRWRVPPRLLRKIIDL
jgi:hypothetical protein